MQSQVWNDRDATFPDRQVAVRIVQAYPATSICIKTVLMDWKFEASPWELSTGITNGENVPEIELYIIADKDTYRRI